MQKEGCLMRNRKMNICYLRRKTKTACAVSVSVVREVDICCIPSHVFKKEKTSVILVSIKNTTWFKN